jgi:hypothetical protein
MYFWVSRHDIDLPARLEARKTDGGECNEAAAASLRHHCFVSACKPTIAAWRVTAWRDTVRRMSMFRVSSHRMARALSCGCGGGNSKAQVGFRACSEAVGNTSGDIGNCLRAGRQPASVRCFRWM